MATLPPEEVEHQMKNIGDDRRIDIIASLSILLAIAYAALGFRFLSRRLANAKISYDDWMMTVGVFLTTCYCIGCFVFHMGMGRHAILIKEPVAFAKTVLTTEVLYTPASTAIKWSILLLYRRLFPGKKFKIVLLSLGIFLMVFALAQMLSVIIQCTPPAALWDPVAHPGAKCDNYAPVLILFAVINAVTDVTILCLPMPILWNLHASTADRRRLIGIFGLGGLVCVVSICRAGYVDEVALTDPSWNDVNTVILSGIENCAGVLSACLVTMLPIWHHLRRGRAVPSKSDPSFPPSASHSAESKASSTKKAIWPGSGIRKGMSSVLDRSFGRLEEEDLEELGPFRHPTSPHNGIKVTTNVETF